MQSDPTWQSASGLPPEVAALRWAFECIAAGSPDRGLMASVRALLNRAAREGGPIPDPTFRQASGVACEVLRAGRTAWRMTHDAAAPLLQLYGGAAEKARSTQRPQALWCFAEHVAVPFLAHHLHDCSYSGSHGEDRVAYALASPGPCPMAAWLNHRTPVPTLHLPHYDGTRWVPPVARVLEAVYAYLGTNRHAVAHAAQDDPKAPECRLKRLQRWEARAMPAGPGRPTTPRIKQLEDFVKSVRGAWSSKNAFDPFLSLSARAQATYVVRFYERHYAGRAEYEEQIQYVYQDAERFRTDVVAFAEKQGRIEPEALLRYLVFARAMQVAIFGTAGKTGRPGMADVAVTLWRDAADAQLDALLNGYRSVLEQPYERRTWNSFLPMEHFKECVRLDTRGASSAG